MTVTSNTYAGNGVQTDFPFSFSYILADHVKVKINGIATTAFTFFSPSVLRFTTAPPNGSEVEIYRETPDSSLLADFNPGSALREEDLEKDLRQVLYVAQEVKSIAEGQTTEGLQAQIDALSVTANTANTNALAATVTANAASALVLANYNSVLKFGADPTGVNDSAAAFQAAINAAGTGIRSAVYVPPGTYRIDSTLVWTNKFVSLVGAGRGVSVLMFGASVSIGLHINNSGAYYSVDITGLTVGATSTTPTGTAIKITWPESFFGRNIHKGTIRNVQIEGYDGTSTGNITKGWLRGIHYTQALFVAVEDCGILGKDTNGTNSNSQSDKSVSQTGILFDGGAYPCDIRVTNSFINCWDVGFRASGSPEGLQFHNFTSLQCRVNIQAQPTTFTNGTSAAFRPQLVVSDSHMSCFENNIFSDGMVNIFIHHNLFYALPSGNQAIEMIRVSNSVDVNIATNTFQSYSTTQNVTGVALSSMSVGTGTEVTYNAFGPMYKGIHIKNTATSVRLEKNKTLLAAGESFSFGFIHDQGVDTVFDRRLTHLAVSSGATVTIPNNAYTAIPWTVELLDNANFFSSGTRLTNPGLSVRRVRLTAQVFLSAPGGGVREIVIAKNGQKDFSGCAAVRLEPVTAASTVVNLSTPVIPLEPGEYLEVFVFQTSGSNATVDNFLGRTHCSLEIIE